MKNFRIYLKFFFELLNTQIISKDTSIISSIADLSHLTIIREVEKILGN